MFSWNRTQRGVATKATQTRLAISTILIIRGDVAAWGRSCYSRFAHELLDVSCMRRVRYGVVRASVGPIAISYANVLVANLKTSWNVMTSDFEGYLYDTLLNLCLLNTLATQMSTTQSKHPDGAVSGPGNAGT